MVYFFVYRALDDDFIVNKRGDGPALQSKVCFEVVDKFPFRSFSGARENARLFFFSGCLAVPELTIDNETSRLGNFSFDLFDRKGSLFIGNTIQMFPFLKAHAKKNCINSFFHDGYADIEL